MLGRLGGGRLLEGQAQGAGGFGLGLLLPPSAGQKGGQQGPGEEVGGIGLEDGAQLGFRLVQAVLQAQAGSQIHPDGMGLGIEGEGLPEQALRLLRLPPIHGFPGGQVQLLDAHGSPSRHPFP